LLLFYRVLIKNGVKIRVFFCDTPMFSVLLLLIDVIVQQLDDQIHMGQDHSAAAVSLATKLVESFPKILNSWLMFLCLIRSHE